MGSGPGRADLRAVLSTSVRHRPIGRHRSWLAAQIPVARALPSARMPSEAPQATEVACTWLPIDLILRRRETFAMVTAAERAQALGLLDDFLNEQPLLQASRDSAWAYFVGDYAHCYEKAQAHGVGPTADEFFDMWFLLEESLRDAGRRLIERLLSMNDDMSDGARAYLEQLADSSVGLYEVVDVEPGRSILLMNLSDHRGVRVAERTASRAVEPHALLAARIIEPGVSGEPALERGVLNVPRQLRERLVKKLSDLAWDLQADGMSPREIARESAVMMYHAWLSSFEPKIPALHNTDGEKLVWKKLVFRILDRARLLDALRAAEGVDEGPDDDVFSWIGDNDRRRSGLAGSYQGRREAAVRRGELGASGESGPGPHRRDRVRCRGVSAVGAGGR